MKVYELAKTITVIMDSIEKEKKKEANIGSLSSRNYGITFPDTILTSLSG